MTAFTSLNELENGTALRADLAIVGAGAAGITLALALADTDLDVLLIESGNLELEGATQELSDGLNVGMEYVPLMTARQRFFGGSTNHWTGWCSPLDPIDFRPRPWLGIDGWPFDLGTLMPYYERAQETLGLGEFVYDQRLWDEIGVEVDAFDWQKLSLTFRRRSVPVRMGPLYAPALRAAANVRVLLDANVTGAELAREQPRIERLAIRSLEGRKAAVYPARVVLACGGIDNPRLLLAWAGQQGSRLGNRHDQIGRCFNEHPAWIVGKIACPDPSALVDTYYRRMVHGRPCAINWCVAEAHQEAIGIANHALTLWPTISQSGEPPADAATPFARAAAMLDELGGQIRRGWRTIEGSHVVNRPVRQVDLLVKLDALPNPSSRVTLAEDHDALGLPKAQLDWRVTEEDEHGMVKSALTVAAELARLGLGRVQLHPALAEPGGGWARAGNLIGTGIQPDAPEMDISWHHKGTTRMSTDPRKGVVDANCRVHGVDNLYIAGSSVFPTSSHTNPTMTIVALAYRLADHLTGLGNRTATGAVRPLVDDLTPR